MEVLSPEAVCPRLLEVIALDILHNVVDHLATVYVEDHLGDLQTMMTIISREMMNARESLN